MVNADCTTCQHQHRVDICSYCTNSNINAIFPFDRHDKYEPKEKKMYEPTEKCTMNNIAIHVWNSGCEEAMTEFFKCFYSSFVASSDLKYDEKITEGRASWVELTKVEKRTDWLLKHGFIKEKIELKPCPFCGYNHVQACPDDSGNVRIRCDNCGSYGAIKQTTTEANEAWNKRQ